MDLYEKFNKDMVEAMKNKDKERLTVLRMIKGAMQLDHINNKKEMDESLLIDSVSKQIKMRNDSLEEFKKGNREDLIEQTEKEIAILNEYLPEQLTEEEVDAIIDEAFAALNPTQSDMGKVMGYITPKVKGKADLSSISKTVKERLSNL